MNKVIEWFKASNRWKHLLGGFAVGAGASDWYCAAYAGALTAGALEFKDRAHGGRWDWIDFSLTILGAAVGQLLHRILIDIIIK